MTRKRRFSDTKFCLQNPPSGGRSHVSALAFHLLSSSRGGAGAPASQGPCVTGSVAECDGNSGTLRRSASETGKRSSMSAS